MKSLYRTKSTNNRIGRGLDELLGPVDSTNQSLTLGIEKVFPNKSQPRKDFSKDSLLELANSIKENGVLQPILVEKKGDSYLIIAGERRWRATCMAGLKKIPALLKTEVTKKDSSLWALLENLQREDLNSIEQALAFKQIMQETGWNQDSLAKHLSVSRSALANTLRLLNLDPEVQILVRQKKLSFSQARELLQFKDFKKQKEMAQACLDKSLTVRKIKNKKTSLTMPFVFRKTLAQIEKQFERSLTLRYTKGKGQLSFSFKNDEELKKIFNQLLNKDS